MKAQSHESRTGHRARLIPAQVLSLSCCVTWKNPSQFFSLSLFICFPSHVNQWFPNTLEDSSQKENLFKGTITATDIIYMLGKKKKGCNLPVQNFVLWKRSSNSRQHLVGQTAGLSREQVDR